MFDWGLGDLMPPRITTHKSGSTLETSTFTADEPVRIVVQGDQQAQRALWWVMRDGNEWKPQEFLGNMSNGRLEIYKNFPAGWYTIVVATPEAGSNEFFPQSFTYITVTPAPTLSGGAPPSTTTTTTTTTPTTTQPRTVTTPVVTTGLEPAYIAPTTDPFIAATQQQQCPAGYYWDLLRWPEPGCSIAGSVVTGTPGQVITVAPPTTTPRVEQPSTNNPTYQIYDPGYPVYVPLPGGGGQYQTLTSGQQGGGLDTSAISEFFSAKVNILGVDVPIVALIAALWFLK